MAVDRIEELTRAFERFPGIGPRQARRFVYHLLSAGSIDRNRLADLIAHVSDDVRQCSMCMRFAATTGSPALCSYCSDTHRDDTLLMIVEKDQDLQSVERARYRGRYFVLGGVITLSGKGTIRERDLVRVVEARSKNGLTEIVLALSATSEGEHTADRVRELLQPLRGSSIRISELGRGLATGSELEYSDAETLSSALINRKET